jgi:LmbE family N-acetylglucosaminyl deacetylase
MSENVLVLAAHADDETLGTFYAIQKHIAKGDSVTVMLMTYDSLRRKEFANALHKTPGRIAKVYAKGLADGGLKHQVKPMASQISVQLIRCRPDVVYCHSRNEPLSVSDHLAVYKAFKLAAKRYARSMVLKEYPV